MKRYFYFINGLESNDRNITPTKILTTGNRVSKKSQSIMTKNGLSKPPQHK